MRNGRAARQTFDGGTRKTLCTRMNRPGVSPAVAMRIMPHVDAKPTMLDNTDDENLGREAIPEVPAAPLPAAPLPAAQVAVAA